MFRPTFNLLKNSKNIIYLNNSLSQNSIAKNSFIKTSKINLVDAQKGIKTKTLYDYEPLTKVDKSLNKKDNYFVFGDEKLSQILEKKELKKLLYVKDSDMIYTAIEKMVENGVGAMLVVNSNDNSLCGIVSERDYLNKVALKGLNSKSTPVKHIMTSNLKTMKPSTCALEALHLMTYGRFRHIPITDQEGKNVIGLISITDLIKSIRKSQKETLRYLREFLNDPSGYSVHNIDPDTI
ncbi:hypothetical protein DLAC_05049 [Tieghemostelium lacteum]|uniref:CBS domain-containing protein n=1 Tax=Tieghemostelium lacteum TaxID=361077 RepID=A0A151ZIJ0_TIELA|nr:hypothetical protein DLAC_05049 [Tieghemostelium lacteum]|eukprot:KYQ93664.1 hypothetical protein DLAC_05049 [Tieghemostelium lacteum]